MKKPIGVGVVGLSARGNWGALAHLPALQAVDDVELRGLVAGSPTSTVAAAEKYGVRGFESVSDLAHDDDIDLIALTVRVPEHWQLLEPILATGKAILCEWPLALNLAEAERMVSASSDAPRFIGLQGRHSPTIRWVQELIAEGYLGTISSSSMLASFPGGGPTFTSGSAYTADAANGATMLTIAFAHALDLQTMLLGDLADTSATLATLQTEALVTDTGARIGKSSPDQIAVSGRLPGGSVVSMHFRAAAYRTTPFLWEIDGAEGSLRITGETGLPMSTALRVEGARTGERMTLLSLPDRHDRYSTLIGGPAHNVAHQYARIADAISGGDAGVPTFADGVKLHRALEAITSEQVAAKSKSRQSGGDHKASACSTGDGLRRVEG